MQQREVYDRRTSQDKVVGGVNLTASIAGKILDPSTQTTQTVSGEDDISEEDDIAPEKDDIVGLVEEQSTQSKPCILLGKVLRVNNKKRTVLLAHLRPIKQRSNKYQLEVGKSTWEENFKSLIFPIDINYDSKLSLYILRTPQLHIHNAVKK